MNGTVNAASPTSRQHADRAMAAYSDAIAAYRLHLCQEDDRDPKRFDGVELLRLHRLRRALERTVQQTSITATVAARALVGEANATLPRAMKRILGDSDDAKVRITFVRGPPGEVDTAISVVPEDPRRDAEVRALVRRLGVSSLIAATGAGEQWRTVVFECARCGLSVSGTDQ